MDIWKHGKYADAWSVVHFLAGFLLSASFYWLGASFVSTLAFSILLMAVWEIFEWATGIIEPSPNVGFDIFIGLAGFILAALLYFWQGLTLNPSVFFTLLALTLLLALWGFVDFLKRGYR